MINRILVPLDGSKTAERILPLVIDEARLREAEVVTNYLTPRQSLMTTLLLSTRLMSRSMELRKIIEKSTLINFERMG